MNRPKDILKVLEENNYQCKECGNDQYVIVSEGQTFCRLCFAEKAGLKLKFESPTIEVINELVKQGKGNKFVCEFLGLSPMQILRIKKS